jgi:hypothetical protein
MVPILPTVNFACFYTLFSLVKVIAGVEVKQNIARTAILILREEGSSNTVDITRVSGVISFIGLYLNITEVLKKILFRKMTKH